MAGQCHRRTLLAGWFLGGAHRQCRFAPSRRLESKNAPIARGVTSIERHDQMVGKQKAPIARGLITSIVTLYLMSDAWAWNSDLEMLPLLLASSFFHAP